MTIAPAVLDAMLAGGCTREQIVAAIKADAQADVDRLAAKRAKDAERQRRHRASLSRPSRDVTVTGCDKSDPPKENKSNPPVPPSSTDVDDPPPPIQTRFVEAWNAEPGLVPARALTGQRLKKFRTRLKEVGEANLFDAVRRLGSSAFHCGKNDRGWKADIGWLIRSDETVTKALELPAANAPAMTPDQAAAAADKAAAFFHRMGRDDDAREAETRAASLRSRSGGPPRPIGDLLPGIAP